MAVRVGLKLRISGHANLASSLAVYRPYCNTTSAPRSGM